MSDRFDELAAAVLARPDEERGHLAQLLLASLDDEGVDDPADVERALAEEIGRRSKNWKSGKGIGIPAEDALAETWARLNAAGSESAAKLARIEAYVRALDARNLAAFREWFAEYDADAWDRQIEADARSGKLDAMAQRALEAHRTGRTRPL
jgi:hypothetical protein